MESLKAEVKRVKHLLELAIDTIASDSEPTESETQTELKTLFEEEGFTDQQLADIVGVSKPAVNRWRHGKRQMPLEVADNWIAQGDRWYRRM